jgi:copper chaperone
MIEMTIPAMSCGGCAKGIARVCAAVDPKAKVEADPRSKRLTVESVEPREKFAAALTAAGYPPAE